MAEKKQSYCAGCSEAELKLFEPAIEQLISLANEEILPRFLAGTEVFDKKDHTPVTAADRGAEKVMREWIEAHFPAHGIFGEEFGIKEASGDVSRATAGSWIRSMELVLYHNAFHFGTLIAVERDDGNGFQPMLGVSFTSPRRRLGSSEMGSGRFCTVRTASFVKCTAKNQKILQMRRLS